MKRYKVLAIAGSTRNNSTNHRLIKAIESLAAQHFDVIVFNSIASLPHFNPDEDNNAPEEVKDFRRQINSADGVIICTPEYAHGVPGTLKNAIDWTVGSCGFSQKPTMLITASTDGQFAHKALLETLKVIEAENIENLQLLIQFAQTKINRENKIIDEKTLAAVNTLIESFAQTINAHQ